MPGAGKPAPGSFAQNDRVQPQHCAEAVGQPCPRWLVVRHHQPRHRHRHCFKLTRIAGKPTAGVIKDVVMLGGFQELEFDFIADNPGLTLFHCHQQLHMDFGFMALFKYG